MSTGGSLGSAEVIAALTAAAEVARLNQSQSTIETNFGDASGSANPDTESEFTTEECNTPNTYTKKYMQCMLQCRDQSKGQVIQNLHNCIGHIAPERLLHLVENGQWS